MKVARFLPEIFDDLSAAGKSTMTRAVANWATDSSSVFYSAVHRMSQTADAHRYVYHDFRRVVVQPFPYKLFFRVVGDDVVFALLIHVARDPKTVEKLLRSRTRRLG